MTENIFPDPNDNSRLCTDFSRTYLTETNPQKRELNDITHLGWDPDTQAMTVFMPVLTRCVESAAYSTFPVMYDGSSRSVRSIYMAYNAPVSNGGHHGEYSPGMPYSELGMNGHYYYRRSDFQHPLQGTDGTLIHEFLHGFGLFYHADRLNCKDSPNCGTRQYGNTLSEIGRGDYAFELDPNERFNLHFMDPEDFLVIDSAGSFTIGPLEQSLSSTHKRASVIVGSTYSFFVEYRQAAGFDSTLDAFPDSDLGKNVEGIIITQGNNVIPVNGLSETIDSDGNLVWVSLVGGDSVYLLDTGIWVGNVMLHGQEGVTFEVRYDQTPPETTLSATTVTADSTAAATEPGPCHETHVEVELITKQYGYEITWQVGPCTGGDYQDHQTYTEFCCLPAGTHEVRCEDSYGDGWHGGSLSVDGHVACTDVAGFGMTSSVTISSTPHTGPSSSHLPSQFPETTTISDFMDTSTTHVATSIQATTTTAAVPSSTSNIASSAWSTTSSVQSYAASTVPPTSPITSSGSECRNLEITTQSWGNEITWTLGSCSGGPYSDYNTFSEECCIPDGQYELACTDSYGDGWHGGYLLIDEVSYCQGFTTGHNMEVQVVLNGELTVASSFSTVHKVFGFPNNAWVLVSLIMNGLIVLVLFRRFCGCNVFHKDPAYQLLLEQTDEL